MPDLGMGDDRKKRAELKTVPKMKPPSKTPAAGRSSAPDRTATAAKRPAGKRGGWIEELGEQVRRDPRREQD